MKWRMAENSLFAILLRSSPWISFAIAAALGLVTTALLPAEVRAVGPITGLPFLIVGAIALRRRWRQPSAKQAEALLQAVGAMNWAEFGPLLERAFAAGGYVVQPAPPSSGADFTLERQGQRTLVGARRWKSARIGVEALKPLQAARVAAEAERALFVGLGELTDQARPFAAEHGITVWGPAELARALHAAGVQPGRARGA